MLGHAVSPIPNFSPIIGHMIEIEKFFYKVVVILIFIWLTFKK